MKKQKISLPQKDHCEYLDTLLMEAIVAYDLIQEKMVKELISLMKEEGLYKSDLDMEKKRAMIRIPFQKLSQTIDKYLLPIRWMFLGKMAGKKAEEVVDELKLRNKIPAGIIYSSFLDSIDAQRKYQEILDPEASTDVPPTFMKVFLESIKHKSKKYIDSNLLDLKNGLLQTIEDAINGTNLTNLSQINEVFHEGGKAERKKISPEKMSIDLKDVFNKFSKKYETLVNTENAMASSVGSYVGTQSLFADKEDDVRVAIVSVLDNRCCDACERLSRANDGSILLYKLNQVKPAGYNFRKSKRSWEPSVPPFHPDCRCTLVYVPKGFTIDKDGIIWPGGQNENNTSNKPQGDGAPG